MKTACAALIFAHLAGAALGSPQSSLQFDGVDDFVSASSVALPTGGADRTIEFWVKSSNFEQGGDRLLLSWGDQSNNQFCGIALGHWMQASRKLFFWGWYNDLDWTTPLEDDRWYHIAFTVQGVSAHMYVDGQLDSSGTITGLDTSAGSTFYLSGPVTGNTTRFLGAFDEVRVWNRALTQDELRSKMNATLDPAAENGLVLYWRLNEGMGSTARDATGLGGDGTVTGATWAEGVPHSPLQWSASIGGNSHWYELEYSASPVLWQDAQQIAEARGGYLATITSAAEHNWVCQTVLAANAPEDGAVQDILLGGYHNHQSPIYREPDLGWEWVTGEPWDYVAWRSGEPSDLGDRGDYLAYASFPVLWWNDTGSGAGVDIHHYYLVEYDGPKLHIRDVPADQGGLLQLSWDAFYADAPEVLDPLVGYDVQRFEAAGWTTLTSIAAALADSYQVTVPTGDVLTLGIPAPYSKYRVRATTASPARFYFSSVDSAYSIDNLPPEAPQLALYDTEASRTLVWQADEIADVGETCLYRDTVSVRPPAYFPVPDFAA